MGGGQGAVGSGPGASGAVGDLVGLARMNGLELTEAEAEELRPFYDRMQGWLEALRRVLADDEEPATIFVAGRGADVPG